MEIDKNKLSQFYYGNNRYDFLIIKKRVKNISVRQKDQIMILTVPLYLSNVEINKYAKILLPRFVDKYLKQRILPYSFANQYLYLFGERHELNVFTSRGESFYYFEDERELKKYLKKTLLNYLNVSVRKYSSMMNIPTDKYKIVIRDMKTRFGSNSQKTMTLCFQLGLVHFSPMIIDSVIVHELAHEFVHAHNRKFYQIILKYFPSYFVVQQYLKKGIYHYEEKPQFSK